MHYCRKVYSWVGLSIGDLDIICLADSDEKMAKVTETPRQHLPSSRGDQSLTPSQTRLGILVVPLTDDLGFGTPRRFSQCCSGQDSVWRLDQAMDVLGDGRHMHLVTNLTPSMIGCAVAKDIAWRLLDELDDSQMKNTCS